MANSAFGLHGGDPPLDDASLAEHPPFRCLGHPSFEQHLLADQGRPSVAQAEAHGRAVMSANGVRGREDDVEGGGQSAAVHASRRPLVGHVEAGVTQRLRRLGGEPHGERQGVERTDGEVEGHGVLDLRAVLRGPPSPLVRSVAAAQSGMCASNRSATAASCAVSSAVSCGDGAALTDKRMSRRNSSASACASGALPSRPG